MERASVVPTQKDWDSDTLCACGRAFLSFSPEQMERDERTREMDDHCHICHAENGTIAPDPPDEPKPGPRSHAGPGRMAFAGTVGVHVDNDSPTDKQLKLDGIRKARAHLAGRAEHA